MVYVQDAYTTSDRFPNAQRFDAPPDFDLTGLGNDDFDYIRNSVKITVDAYDGTMHFYVNDPDDPIIRAYQGVFPALFEPMSAMPADLAPHLRVPEDLFNVQTNMFGRYHVTNTQQFFGADDLWTVPTQTSEQTLPSEAYYVEMRLPNEDGVEFLLLQPMVPTGRPNMIAWVAARMDGAELRRGAGLSLPGGHDDLRACPDRGQDRPGPAHQRPGLALEPVGKQGHPREPDRRAARRRADLPPAGLPAVDGIRLPRVHAHRRRLAAPGRLGRNRSARRSGSCWRPRTSGAPRSGADTDPDARPVARTRLVTDARPDPGSDTGRRRCRPTCRGSSTTRTPTSNSPRRRCVTATSPATAPRSHSSRLPSSDSRSSLPAARSQARGHRPAPRRDPRRNAARGVARHARAARHLAARPRPRSWSAAGSS